jgi:hypothetical protein
MTAPPGDVEAAAREALLQVLQPLTSLLISAGLSAGDMCLLLREAAVKSVAKSQLEMSRRTNISGIAATTGIPRAEISRILKKRHVQDDRKNDRRQQSTNRILAQWYRDSKFAGLNGEPAALRLYGRGATFESLVKLYGRGVPVRAVLDELVRSGAVRVLPGQRIKANASLAVDMGLNPQRVKSFGDLASGLLTTMLSHMREAESSILLKTVTIPATPDTLRLIRKEISNRSAAFLSQVRELSATEPRRHVSRTVRVTILCHEGERRDLRKISSETRINFRRRPSASKLQSR